MAAIMIPLSPIAATWDGGRKMGGRSLRPFFGKGPLHRRVSTRLEIDADPIQLGFLQRFIEKPAFVRRSAFHAGAVTSQV